MGSEAQSWWRKLIVRLFGERSRSGPNWEILQSTTISATVAPADQSQVYVPPALTHPAHWSTVVAVPEEAQNHAIALTLDQPKALSVSTSRIAVSPAAAPADYTYALRDDFLSRAEQSFFHVLRDAVAAEYLIFPKVRLADLVFPPRQEGQFGAWQRINRKHVDFVLCDPRTLRPLAALELDDRSHRRPDRLERDAFVEQVFADASLPLIRVPAQRTYHRQTIATLVAEAITRQGPTVIVESAATGAEVKTCDRCGGEMKIRTAAQGAHRGEQFWGCTNYPKCRNIVKIAADPALYASA